MHYVMNTVTFERLKCPRKASFLVLSSKPTKTLSHSVVALQASTQAGVFQYIFFFQSLISVFLPKLCTRWFCMSRTYIPRYPPFEQKLFHWKEDPLSISFSLFFNLSINFLCIFFNGCTQAVQQQSSDIFCTQKISSLWQLPRI